MKKILKAEEIACFAAGIAGLHFLDFSFNWWIWPLIFLAPDISMLGYLAGNRTGAFTYNLFHHKGIAICLAAIGFFSGSEIFLFLGCLLFAHSSFDRIWGYGLKYEDSFSNTHLGPIGKAAIHRAGPWTEPGA